MKPQNPKWEILNKNSYYIDEINKKILYIKEYRARIKKIEHQKEETIKQYLIKK